MTDEARDPGDVALLSTVGVVLEMKDISDLSEGASWPPPAQGYRDIRAVARDAR